MHVLDVLPRSAISVAHLVKIDDWLPESVLHLVEVSHTDLTKVTGMILVEIGSMV